MSKMAQEVGAIATGSRQENTKTKKPSSKGFGRKFMEKKEAEAKANGQEKAEVQPTLTTPISRPKTEKSLDEKVLKVRVCGALLVPRKMVESFGFKKGEEYTCKKGSRPREFIVVGVGEGQ